MDDPSGIGSSSGSRHVWGATDRLLRWLLLDGNRVTVAAALTGVVFGAFVGLELVGLTPFRRTQPVYYVFGGFLSGNLTLVTVVVSINQLLLSQELQTPSELRSQIEGVIDYRREVEDAAGDIAPVEPLGFLRLIFDNIREEAQRLGGAQYPPSEGQISEEIDDFVSDMTAHVDHVDDLLVNSETDTFDVLSVALTTNYARQINYIRRIRHSHGDELSDVTMDAFDRLIDRLQDVDVARQYFKSIYLQEELSSLSRALLYTGVPAEITAAAVLVSFAASGSAALSQSELRVVLPLAVTVCFVPLAVLFAYILRTATVTQRTAATIPFTTPTQEQ